MEKIEKETHDFMNVHSFSQLPLIRPPPSREKGIRLFGIDFGANIAAASESVETNISEEANKDTADHHKGESNRKFECHYCCRNFPTSQALGGHQNAHKRERQHAKRAHLHAAMAHGSGLSEAHHIYGLMNYHRLGSAPISPMTYHSFNTIHSNNSTSCVTNATSRFYGSQGLSSSSRPVTINGSPMAVWQIPSVQNLATFNHDRSMHPSQGDLKLPSMIGSSSSQSRYGYESKQDHVSLDLHL